MKIILFSNSKMDFEAIVDRLEYQNPSDQIFYGTNSEEASELISEKEPCIVITNALIPSKYNTNKDRSVGVKFILRRCRKNSNCRVILYSLDFGDLKLTKFDCYLNSRLSGSYEDLFKKIEEYKNQFVLT